MATRQNVAAWSAAVPGIHLSHPLEQQLRALLRYATLAPSTRNSQPWRFTVDGAVVLMRADPTRWQTVADASRRELHLSLGCALENLLIATSSAGFRHAVTYFPDPTDPDLAAVITFTAGARPVAVGPITLDTLQFRHTEHRPFLSRAIPAEVLERLRDVPGESGVRLQLSDGEDIRRQVDVLNVRALGTLFGSAPYREELARAVGQGSFGTPWLGNQLGRLVIPHVSMARRLARQDSQALLSAPLLGLIGTIADTPAEQVRSGRLLERLWLTATALGLALQPVSQALQVPSLRSELATQFPEAGEHPQQLVRIGYAASRPSHATPRRALEDVLTSR